MARTNKATDALSQCPEPNCKLESDSDTDSDDQIVLSYATICAIIKPVLEDTKILFAIKKEAWGISNSLEGEIGMNVPEFHAVSDLTVHISAVSVFDQVSLATMAEAQTKDSVLGLVIPYVHKGETKGSVISKIRCKAVCKYLLQFDNLILKQCVLHQIYITNDVESHQLVLPMEFICYMMTMVIRDWTRH